MGEAKAPLAMTAKDHESIGSTAPDFLKDNPGKTQAETMSDGEIAAWLGRSIDAAQIAYNRATDPNEPRREMWRTEGLPLVRDKFLLLDIEYLREIGRLPDHLAEEDFAAKFALDDE